MSITAISGSIPSTGSATARLCAPVFAATLVVSASLLFGVQPMFAKMVLPVLGGSPAVWSVATVVFQMLLLAGYAYAHALARLPTGRGLAIHLAVMAAAALTLPMAIAEGWRHAPPPGGEALWLAGLIGSAIGLPFFAVAANAPLLQAWFARTGHPSAQDPYMLYGASNLGSFATLAAYPFLIEPILPLGAQGLAWSIGFALLAALVAASGGLAIRERRPAGLAAAAPSAEGHARPTWRLRLRWIGLAAVPSGLLVAATAHISTDIAAIPLLWIVPLAIYLLSFVVAFRPRSHMADAEYGFATVGLSVIAIGGIGTAASLMFGLVVTIVLFGLMALVCHRALFRSRPSAEHLTAFYLSVSVGGAIGGLMAGIVAPQVTNTILEYPILLVLAVLCRPAPRGGARTSRESLVILAAALLALVGLAAAIGFGVPGPSVQMATVMTLGAFAVLAWRRRRESAAILGLLAALVTILPQLDPGSLTRRSFFGVHKIALTADGRFRMFIHGDTIHGAMRVREDDGTPATGRPEPTTYYGLDGNLGTAIAAVRAASGGTLRSVSAVGLGTGSLACHAHDGEAWTFYEIDEVVIRIARDPSLFRFISDCRPDLPVVLGDARLSFAGAAAGQDLIVLDAFSSDAIPTHLLTREAFGLYASKLRPGGAILAHVSNRHLDLRRVAAAVGAANGFQVFSRYEMLDEPTPRRMRSGSILIAMARDPADLGAIASDPTWTRLRPEPGRAPWTDDYSNLLEALRDRFQAGPEAVFGR